MREDAISVESPQQRWARTHVLERKRSCQAYYQRNKEKILAVNERWWKEHPDKLREKWRRRSKSEAGRAKAKRYREKHAESLKARKRLEQIRNWGHYLKYHAEWRKKNSDRLRPKYRVYARVNGAKRRQLLKKAAGNLKKIREWMHRVLSRSKSTCYWCGSDIVPSNIHFDHIIALARGGSHSIENLCVSCAQCNLSKNARRVPLRIKIGQQVLDL